MSTGEASRAGRLEVRGLECAAGLRTLFAGVDLEVGAGQWLCITGPNGCGKSTLLRAVAGLGRPVAGAIRWDGEPTAGQRERWHAAMVYQGHATGCKDSLSAEENLRWQLALDGRDDSPAPIGEHLERVGLRRQARLPYGRLSAGQRRRLGLARLHALERPLWLLDEPTTALDADGQALFGELLAGHLRRGGCALVATHLDFPVPVEPLRLDLGRSGRP